MRSFSTGVTAVAPSSRRRRSGAGVTGAMTARGLRLGSSLRRPVALTDSLVDDGCMIGDRWGVSESEIVASYRATISHLTPLQAWRAWVSRRLSKRCGLGRAS